MLKQKYQITKKINSKVINEIVQIEKNKGLTPENLLENARERNNPLHDFFDWDNSEAAENWRIHQARMLINQIKIIVEDKVYFGFENVSITTKEGKQERIYKPTMEIISNEEMRLQLVKRALQHQKYWVEQNSKYAELKPIVDIIEKTEKKLIKKWQKKK